MQPKNKNAIIDELIAQDRDRFRRLYDFIRKGVRIVDPFTTHIGPNVKIGTGTTIYPLTVIEGDTSIGKHCTIGPFARIRRGVKIKDTASIGNFVEVVRSTISGGAKVKHLTYVGDATIEKNVNIGAGTIIANYDGKKKHPTLIKQGAFIGSGSILVAPVTVGRKATTGAGAVVTRNKNVPDGTIVVGVPARILRKNGEQGSWLLASAVFASVVTLGLALALVARSTTRHIETLNAKIDTLENTLSQRTETMRTEIGTIENTMLSHTERFSALTGRMDEFSAALDTADLKITDTRQGLLELKKSVDTAVESAQSVGKSQEMIFEELAAMKKKVKNIPMITVEEVSKK